MSAPAAAAPAATTTASTATPASATADAAAGKTPAPADPKAAPATPEKGAEGSAAKVAEAIRKFKLKAGEEEVEVDEPELIRRAQLGFGAEKRLEQASKVMKEWQNVIALLKNPKTAFEIFKHPSIGLDPEKIAEDLIYERLQKEKMTPEQREAAEWKAKATKLEEESREREKEAQTAKIKELEGKFAKDYETGIIQTLEKAGLPKSRRTVARMANYMLAALQEGVTLGPDDVVDMVLQDYMDDVKSLFGGLEGEKLMGILGEDVAKKIRAYDLSRVSGGTATAKEPAKDPVSTPGGKKLTKEEWRKKLDEMGD